MSEQYNIRLAMPKDKEELERLTRELVKEKGERFVEKRYEWGILRRVYDPLQRHGIFVAESNDDDKLVGMIFGELRVDPYGVTECYIKQTFVESAHRNKSIGFNLLKRIIEHLKNIDVKKIKLNLEIDDKKFKEMLEEFKFKPKYTVMELKL